MKNLRRQSGQLIPDRSGAKGRGTRTEESDRIRRRLLVAAASALPMVFGAAISAHAAEAEWRAFYSSGSALLSAPCLDQTVALSVEESRLGTTLADNGNPAVLQST